MTSRPPRQTYRSELPAPKRTRPLNRSRSVPRYCTDELLCGNSWAVIEHEGAEYRLQITRLGKLILTK